MPNNPFIAFDCGACLCRGSVYSHLGTGYAPMTCTACGGSGKISLSIDDLAERIAAALYRMNTKIYMTPDEYETKYGPFNSGGREE